MKKKGKRRKSNHYENDLKAMNIVHGYDADNEGVIFAKESLERKLVAGLFVQDMFKGSMKSPPQSTRPDRRMRTFIGGEQRTQRKPFNEVSDTNLHMDRKCEVSGDKSVPKHVDVVSLISSEEDNYLSMNIHKESVTNPVPVINLVTSEEESFGGNVEFAPFSLSPHLMCNFPIVNKKFTYERKLEFDFFFPASCSAGRKHSLELDYVPQIDEKLYLVLVKTLLENKCGAFKNFIERNINLGTSGRDIASYVFAAFPPEKLVLVKRDDGKFFKKKLCRLFKKVKDVNILINKMEIKEVRSNDQYNKELESYLRFLHAINLRSMDEDKIDIQFFGKFDNGRFIRGIVWNKVLTKYLVWDNLTSFKFGRSLPKVASFLRVSDKDKKEVSIIFNKKNEITVGLKRYMYLYNGDFFNQKMDGNGVMYKYFYEEDYLVKLSGKFIGGYLYGNNAEISHYKKKGGKMLETVFFRGEVDNETPVYGTKLLMHYNNYNELIENEFRFGKFDKRDNFNGESNEVYCVQKIDGQEVVTHWMFGETKEMRGSVKLVNGYQQEKKEGFLGRFVSKKIKNGRVSGKEKINHLNGNTKHYGPCGYYYRSKAERANGVFFSAMGMNFLFEPCSLNIGGKKRHIYTPDFLLLLKQRYWIEVKDSGGESLPETDEKMTKLVNWFINKYPDRSDRFFIICGNPTAKKESGLSFFEKLSTIQEVLGNGSLGEVMWVDECTKCGTGVCLKRIDSFCVLTHWKRGIKYLHSRRLLSAFKEARGYCK